MGRGVRRRGATKTNGKWTGGTFEELASMRFGERELSKIYYGKGILVTDFTASPSSPGTPGESPSPSPTPASVPSGIDNTFATGGSSFNCTAVSYSYPSSTWATEATVPITFYCRGASLGNKSAANYTGCLCHQVFSGTSWSTGTSAPIARRFHAGGGTQNAGIWFGGRVGPAISCCGHTWDGSSFTSTGNAPNNSGQGCWGNAGGTENSAFFFGARNPSYVCSGYYDGTSFSTCAGTYPSATKGFGTVNDAVAFICCCASGNSPSQEWNGSSWSTGISYPRQAYGGGAGIGSTEGLTAGKAPIASCETYEYTSPTYSTGGNLPIGGFDIGVTS